VFEGLRRASNVAGLYVTVIFAGPFSKAVASIETLRVAAASEMCTV